MKLTISFMFGGSSISLELSALEDDPITTRGKRAAATTSDGFSKPEVKLIKFLESFIKRFRNMKPGHNQTERLPIAGESSIYNLTRPAVCWNESQVTYLKS